MLPEQPPPPDGIPTDEVADRLIEHNPAHYSLHDDGFDEPEHGIGVLAVAVGAALGGAIGAVIEGAPGALIGVPIGGILGAFMSTARRAADIEPASTDPMSDPADQAAESGDLGQARVKLLEFVRARRARADFWINDQGDHQVRLETRSGRTRVRIEAARRTLDAACEHVLAELRQLGFRLSEGPTTGAD